MIRLADVVLLVLLINLAPTRTGEQQTTFYPGFCPDGKDWYYISLADDSVTVGCADVDYDDPPAPADTCDPYPNTGKI